MATIYGASWVEKRIEETIELWNASALEPFNAGKRYSPEEQQTRERAYDQGLQAVERELRNAPRTKAERLEVQQRITASFARFSAAALDLDSATINLLTNDFLPVGTKLARWARQFDSTLSMADIIQACRNAWTACGLQPLFGMPVAITPSILGYSLLYPYSDNYLDQEATPAEAKLEFSQRFRRMLRGEAITVANNREAAVRALIELIEGEYPRTQYPDVFECLLAIHAAQENSIRQLNGATCYRDRDLLRVSCGKGGTSVLADGCLAYGRMREDESRFAFEWGVLLQLGDDLQDIHEDLHRGSMTLFSRAAMRRVRLDELALQLLSFSAKVGSRMDRLPHGSTLFKDLLKMSWRSLIIRAVADSHEFFSASFVEEAERCSPFRFDFLRARQRRLAGRQGLYAMLFDAFLESCENDDYGPKFASLGSGFHPAALAAAFE